MAAASPTIPVLSVSDDLEAGFSGGVRITVAPSSGFTNRIPMRRKPSYRAIPGIFWEESVAAVADGGGEHFLDSCFLCRRMLGGNRDIFMYRGDTPFCSEECRQEQIEIDEKSEKRRSLEKKNRLSPAASMKNNGGQQEIRVRPGNTLVVGG